MSKINYLVTAKFGSDHNNYPIYCGQNKKAALLYFKAAIAQGLNGVKIKKHVHAIKYMQFINGKPTWLQ